MPLIKGLYTALTIVTCVNAITSLSFFWPKKNNSASAKVEPKRSDEVWTWKDTIWFILMMMAVLLLIFIVLFSFSVLKMKLLMSVIMVSYYLQQITRSISSAETVGNIVRGKAGKILGANDYVLLFFDTR